MYLSMYHLLRHQHNSVATKRARPGILAPALLPLLMLIGAHLSAAQPAEILAEFNPNQQLRITRVCAPDQFEEGSNAYNQCVLDRVLDQMAITSQSLRQNVPELATSTPDSTTNTLNESGNPDGNADTSLQLKLIAIASAVSIPLLLLGIWLARKQEKYQPHSPPAQYTVKADDYAPDRPDLRPLAPASRLPRNHRVTMSDTADIEDELNETYVQAVETRAYREPQNNTQKGEGQSILPEHLTDLTAAQKLPADRDSFAVWLTQLPAQRQQEHAIELLIYWMAYADNRYDPALKKSIFLMKDPDAHSLIKRWVFKKDASAFADAVKYLQTNTDLEQRRQVIDLLMALLINENALTPNQNVLLRFLADAFGIGRAELETHYRQAFGQTMPITPRPDKSIWWKTLNTEQRLRWNVHAIARLPEKLRFRILLGQPLSGTLDRQSAYRSYTLAMQRCHHEHVSRLGEQERVLLSTKREKFIAAHNALLEPVA